MNEHDGTLDALLSEMRRVRAARRRRGVTVIVGGLALAVAATVWPVVTPTPAPAPTPPVAINPPTAPVDPPTPTPTRDRPSPVVIVSTNTTPSTVTRITDEELIELLNTQGRPTGLIRRTGEVRLDAEWLTQTDDPADRSSDAPTPPSPTA
ncbi:MAG: hypothetical protein Tsb0013_08840 [Phycisphaerales bacterium]